MTNSSEETRKALQRSARRSPFLMKMAMSADPIKGQTINSALNPNSGGIVNHPGMSGPAPPSALFALYGAVLVDSPADMPAAAGEVLRRDRPVLEACT